MFELWKILRLLGPRHMWKLRQAYRRGWADMIGGYCSTRAMQALLNTGVIDEMLSKGPVDVQEFSRSAGLNPEILEPLCKALYCVHILRKVGNRYDLDHKGRLLTDVFRGWFEVNYGYLEIFESLEELLRNQKVYGRDFNRRGDFVAKGSGEMESWLFFPMCNQIIIEGGYRRVLDLGCGDGTFLRKLCQINREVQCFGIDLSPEAIEDGIGRARGLGLGQRIQLYAGDIQNTEGMPEAFQSIDVATVFFVLHELVYWGEQRAVDFLAAFRGKFPGVPLVVFEAVRPEIEKMHRHPGIAVYYYLYHDLSHQKPVTREQWKNLFRAAGFTSIEEHYLRFASSAIYILK